MLYRHRDNRDYFGVPLLIAAGYADPAGMTIEACGLFCDSQSVPYRFMGLTDGFQCSTSSAQYKICIVFANLDTLV